MEDVLEWRCQTDLEQCRRLSSLTQNVSDSQTDADSLKNFRMFVVGKRGNILILNLESLAFSHYADQTLRMRPSWWQSNCMVLEPSDHNFGNRMYPDDMLAVNAGLDNRVNFLWPNLKKEYQVQRM